MNKQASKTQETPTGKPHRIVYANKRAIDLERNMITRMRCRAMVHAVKSKGRIDPKGKTAHYMAAFTGKPVTAKDFGDMIAQSTATANLAPDAPKLPKLPTDKRSRMLPPGSEYAGEISGFVIVNNF